MAVVSVPENSPGFFDDPGFRPLWESETSRSVPSFEEVFHGRIAPFWSEYPQDEEAANEHLSARQAFWAIRRGRAVWSSRGNTQSRHAKASMGPKDAQNSKKAHNSGGTTENPKRPTSRHNKRFGRRSTQRRYGGPEHTHTHTLNTTARRTTSGRLRCRL